MIYNPYFEGGIDAVVMPIDIRPYPPNSCGELFKVTNIRGARSSRCRTKVTTVGLADEVSTTARIAGAANALLKRDDGTLLADMFDRGGLCPWRAEQGPRSSTAQQRGGRLRRGGLGDRRVPRLRRE